MKKYAAFIREAHDELTLALAEAENMGFHHAAEGTPEAQQYKRLVEVISHVEERRVWYDDTEKKRGRSEARS